MIETDGCAAAGVGEGGCGGRAVGEGWGEWVWGKSRSGSVACGGSG